MNGFTSRGELLVGDILSQNEIDQLLQGLITGEIDAQKMQNATQKKKIRSHDFRRPSKFAKDHIKTLHIIHDNYARLVTNFLTGYLRTLVQVDVLEVQALPYSDFTNSISNPAFLAVVEFSPLTGSIIFEIEPIICFALVDRILGGKGTAVDRVRDFTEIEKAILERISIQMLNILREPWENVAPLRPRLETVETNTQFVQIINPNETVAIITFRARVSDVEGTINICIPHMVIEPVIPKLSTKYWFSTNELETTKDSKNAIEQGVENTVVPVRALLGKSSITVADFLELQIGDVLPLDSSVDSNLDVLVGELVKFRGKPGVRKNRISVKIAEVIRGEGE
jgi:flagellar motor switch protein FliM